MQSSSYVYCQNLFINYFSSFSRFSQSGLKFLHLKMASTIIRKIISTPNAPRPAAPYNQAIVVDRTVYLSGVLGMDKDTGKLVEGGAVPEAIKAFENIRNILAAAGSSIEGVIKCTVLLNNIGDFADVNKEYVKGKIHKLCVSALLQNSLLHF